MKSILSIVALTTLALSMSCASSQKVEDKAMDSAETATDAAVETTTDAVEGAADAATDAVEGAAEAAGDTMAKVELPVVSIDAVEAMLKDANVSVAVLDANGPKTRAEKGAIPGAVMLSSYSDYSLEELPSAKDTKLVFYCGSTTCSASDKAAVKAMSAGYTDVNVLREGIKGWIEAGKTVNKIEAKVEATEAPSEG